MKNSSKSLKSLDIAILILVIVIVFLQILDVLNPKSTQPEKYGNPAGSFCKTNSACASGNCVNSVCQ
jgi:hypothetical protein